MKPIHILILFLSLPALLAAQLKGEYCHYECNTYTCIIFQDNNRFYYEDGLLLGKTQGTGSWALNKQNLTLVFDKDTTKSESSSSYETRSVPSFSDSTQLKFSIIDTKTKTALDGATILFYDALNKITKGGTAYLSEVSESYHLPKSSDSILCIISFMGYESFSFKTVPDLNREFTIRMVNMDKMISGELWVYDIIDASDVNHLQLKRKGYEKVDVLEKI